MSKAKEVALKITSAIVLDGEIVRPGTVVSISDRAARNLLNRGKAELSVGDDEDTAPDLGAMTVKELREFAGEKNIELPENAKKAELIDLITAAAAQ